MKRKSVLLIGNYPPPFGGVPRHIEYLAPYLVEKGWDVHILSGGRTGIEHKNGFTIYKYNRKTKIYNIINSLLNHRRVKHPQFKSVMINSPRDWIGYTARVSVGRRIIEENGVSIISAYNLYSGGPVGAVLSQELGIPLVLTNFGEIYSMTSFFTEYVELINYIYNAAKKFLAMSYHCAESYKLIGLSPHVEVIPYGVDVRKFSPTNDGSKIRQRLGISDKEKVVLFAGRIIRDMGLHTLMDSIPQILEVNDKIKFVIVGAKGDLLPSALQLSGKFRENVFVVPDVPLEELPFHYAASTVVVVPTQGDRACGSLAAIEAMATGKPVIASKIGGIPEIVIDRETGLLVPVNDPTALGHAILDLTGDEISMKDMGKLGRERVEKYFDEDKTDEKIERIFSEVAGV